MSGFLLDSDWIIDFLTGRPETAVDLSRLGGESIFISVIVYSEVWDGILNSRRPEQDRTAFDEFLQSVQVLPVDVEVGRRFAEIRGYLRRSGQRLDNFDLLIAATALHHDLVLLTRNAGHFRRIEGLRLNELPPEADS